MSQRKQQPRKPVSPADAPPPPMFTPFTLRGMTLANRVVVSSMCMYSAAGGLPGDFHLVHYGALAQGGAGLVMTEMTDVSAEARITLGCAGIYTDEHTAAWRRIVDFAPAQSGARVGLQLGHAGRQHALRRKFEYLEKGRSEPGQRSHGTGQQRRRAFRIGQRNPLRHQLAEKEHKRRQPNGDQGKGDRARRLAQSPPALHLDDGL